MKQKRNPLTWRWNLTGKEVTDTGPLKILIVDQLPPTWEEWVIYIVQGALYSTMYVRDSEHNVFVKVGTTQVTVQEQADRTEEDTTSVTYIKNKPVLAEVATTGSFDSLVDAPEIPEVYNTTITFKKNWDIIWTITLNQEEPADIDFNIPTKTSDIENDSGFITKEVNNLTNYTKTEDLADVALSNDYEDLDNKPEIPTKLSDLENDTWFIDNTVNNLVNYYTKNKLYTKQQIDEMLGNLSGIRIEIVEELPNPWEFGVIYLVETETPGTYNQYILTESPNTYAMIGSTAVDLSQYFNKVTDTSDDITEGDTNLFMTEAEKTNLSHQSWYNTGDETKITIQQKLGPASATNDGYLKKEDRRDFDAKVDYDDFIWVDASSWTININSFSTEITTGSNVTINCGSSVRPGLVYVLKVNATSDMQLILWNWVTNTVGTTLSVPGWYTKIFVMLATTATTLAMQGVDVSPFVTRDEVEEMIGNWRLILKKDGETLGTFVANQSNNTTIDIPEDITPGMFTNIWTVDNVNKKQRREAHNLWKAPGIVNVDLYAQLPNDEYNRAACSRAMATWKNGQTEFLWTILYFSNWTQPGHPVNMDNLPITINVTNSEVIITNISTSPLIKFRVTAYL